MTETRDSATKPLLELEGRRIRDLEAFWEEVSRSLIPGARRVGNLDAFNDILRGGFGTPDGGFVLRWLNAGLSREALGYAETIRYLEHRVTRCHPSNVSRVKTEIAAARRGEGPTLFDIVLEIVKTHGPGGAESEDGVELELRW